MAKLDGTNGLIQQYDYQVLTTAFSYTFAAGTQTLIINPAGTLATGTVTMPPAPADGMVITIQSTQQITALTLNGNTGQTIVGTAVQLVPNQPLSWVYRLTNTTWYPFAGGAGRASAVVIGTTVASTSGTSIDFTSIPSWAKRITVMLNGVSTNAASTIAVQLGVSGTPETSGYICNAVCTQPSVTMSNSTTSFLATIGSCIASGSTVQGAMVLSTIGSNIWISTSSFSREAGSNTYFASAGNKTLSGVLNMIRLTAGGTDTFDAGSINILYE